MADRIARAAALLVEARQSGHKLETWPAALEPADDAEAAAIQRAVASRLDAVVGGWKVALLPDGKGLAAPIFAADMVASPARWQSRTASAVGIEAEIAFTIGRNLPGLGGGGAYDRPGIIQAIAGASAAIEIVESRFVDIDAVPKRAFLADNLGNGGFIHGPAVVDWPRLDLAQLAVSLRLDGTVLVERRGGHPIGDPLGPLVWLANHLAGTGRPLKAGQIVTTGSFTGLHLARPGQSVEISFDGLGRVALDLG